MNLHNGKRFLENPEKYGYLSRPLEILSSELIAVKRHPKKENQNIMLFKHRGYIWIAAYIEGEDYIFLKTLYPSRKYTKIYRKGGL